MTSPRITNDGYKIQAPTGVLEEEDKKKFLFDQAPQDFEDQEDDSTDQKVKKLISEESALLGLRELLAIFTDKSFNLKNLNINQMF